MRFRSQLQYNAGFYDQCLSEYRYAYRIFYPHNTNGINLRFRVWPQDLGSGPKDYQRLSKRDFAQALLSLEPKLNSTGKIPSESTIYGYLNGGREIKIELIPYIAEVLQVREQELFEFDIEYSTAYNYKLSKEVREIVSLLEYVPHAKIIELKEKLLKYKVLDENEW